jgi:hypothetical protein
VEVIVATVDDELEILFSTDSGVVEADKLLTNSGRIIIQWGTT